MSAADILPTNGLPGRRVEGWRWSDLSAAMAGRDVKLAPGDGPVIARLAEAVGEATALTVGTRSERVDIERIDGSTVARSRSIEIEPGGSYTLVTLLSGDDVTLTHYDVTVQGLATFRQFILSEGARLSRVETRVNLRAVEARVEINGVYLAAAGRHADLTSDVTLTAPGGHVRQLVRGAARRGGRGVFQGKFKVERTAQKTDAQMAHNALLLEEGADVFAKPELEIYADDVQCAHGNTAGQIDEMAVFYLRSRGLPEIEARAMITRAFLVEALPDWLEAETREEIEARIDAWLRLGRSVEP